MGLNGSILLKSLVKSQNQNIFERIKLNQNLRRIPFKLMYNMSMSRHWFSMNGGGSLSYSVKVCIKVVHGF